MGVSTDKLEKLVKALIEGARKLVPYEGQALPTRLAGVEDAWLDQVGEVMALRPEDCAWVQQEVGRRLENEVATADWLWDWCDLEAETSTEGGSAVGILFAVPCLLTMQHPLRERELSPELVWSMENLLKALGAVSEEVKGCRLMNRLWTEAELTGLTWSQVRSLTDCLRAQVVQGADMVDVLAWTKGGSSELAPAGMGTDGAEQKGVPREVGRYLVGVLVVNERDADEAFGDVDGSEAGESALRGAQLLWEREGLGLVQVCSPLGFHEDLRRGQEMERRSYGRSQVTAMVAEVEKRLVAKGRKGADAGVGVADLKWEVVPGRQRGVDRSLMVTVSSMKGSAMYGALNWRWFEWEAAEEAIEELEAVLEQMGLAEVVLLKGDGLGGWQSVGSVTLQ